MQTFLYSPAKFPKNIAVKTLREIRPSETYEITEVLSPYYFKKIFEPQSISALPSSKFMLIGLPDNYIQEHLRISMYSRLKCFSQVYTFPCLISSLNVLLITLCFDNSFNSNCLISISIDDFDQLILMVI